MPLNRIKQIICRLQSPQKVLREQVAAAPELGPWTMPVYKQHELVHIHIPRTGGTAIGAFFNSVGDMPWNRGSWVGQEMLNGRWYEYQHLAIEEFLTLSRNEFSGYRSFAVTRNPYHRLISDFHWRQMIHNNFPQAAVLVFDSFASLVAAIPDDINTNWDDLVQGADQAQANFLIHVRPQVHYIGTMKGAQQVQVLLAFEQLDRDFAALLSPYGISTSRIKPPAARPLEQHYDQAMLDRVARIYSDDFKLGHYPTAV